MQISRAYWALVLMGREACGLRTHTDGFADTTFVLSTNEVQFSSSDESILGPARSRLLQGLENEKGFCICFVLKVKLGMNAIQRAKKMSLHAMDSAQGHISDPCSGSRLTSTMAQLSLLIHTTIRSGVSPPTVR